MPCPHFDRPGHSQPPAPSPACSRLLARRPLVAGIRLLTGLAIGLAHSNTSSAAQLGLDWNYARQSISETYDDYRFYSSGPRLYISNNFWQHWSWSASIARASGSDDGADYLYHNWHGGLSWNGEDNWLSLRYSSSRSRLQVTGEGSDFTYQTNSWNQNQTLSVEFGQDIWLSDQWLLSGWLNLARAWGNYNRNATVLVTSTDTGSDTGSGTTDTATADTSTDVNTAATSNNNYAPAASQQLSQYSNDRQTGIDAGAGLTLTRLFEDSAGRLWAPGIGLDYQKTVKGELLSSDVGESSQYSSQSSDSSSVANSWSAVSVLISVLGQNWQTSLTLSKPLTEPYDPALSWSVGYQW